MGIAGAMEIEENILTLFNLSCHALGRDLEKKMLAFIKNEHEIKSIEFYDTGKNVELKKLLTKVFPSAIIANYGI